MSGRANKEQDRKETVYCFHGLYLGKLNSVKRIMDKGCRGQRKIMQDPVAGWRLIISKLIGEIAQGFDEYDGIPYSNDMWIPANRNPKRNYPSLQWMKGKQAVAHIPDAANQAVLTDAITDAAVKFINEHKNKPFFCYVPHSAVHYPFMVTPERLAAAKDDVIAGPGLRDRCQHRQSPRHLA
jgi:hypothetical protein